MAKARLLYVMDPMCSWCWGFAPVAEALSRQAAAGVQDLGIAGFPTLLAERNGQLALLTNGYQPLAELSPLLGRWLERGRHE